jgi:hypothetical protein
MGMNRLPPKPEPPKPEPPKPEPPKSCPVCFVAMQAITEEHHIVHRCGRCGTVTVIGRPPGVTEKENPTMFYEGERR